MLPSRGGADWAARISDLRGRPRISGISVVIRSDPTGSDPSLPGVHPVLPLRLPCAEGAYHHWAHVIMAEGVGNESSLVEELRHELVELIQEDRPRQRCTSSDSTRPSTRLVSCCSLGRHCHQHAGCLAYVKYEEPAQTVMEVCNLPLDGGGAQGGPGRGRCGATG